MAYESLYKLFILNDNHTFNKIYTNRFESESTIKFDFNINGNEAFFFYHSEISSLLYKIKEYDNKINNLVGSLPKSAQDQYIKKSLIDEIQYSNEIEGVISTRKDIFNIIEDANGLVKNKNRLESIVNKYCLLLENKNIILDSSIDVRKVYDEFLIHEIAESDKNNLPDGKIFRKDPGYVYNNSGFKVIHTGVYPEEQIIEMMDESLSILNNKDLNPYIRVALFHYLFGYIHPFYDGNGRINRFISSYALSKFTTPILKYRLSMTIKENLREYLDAFNFTNDPRNKADLGTFVYSFLNIIYKTYQKTEIYILDKKKIYDYYNNKIVEIKLKDTEKKVLLLFLEGNLFSSFGLSKKDLMRELNLSLPTINNTLKIFKDKSLILQTRIGKTNYYDVSLDNLK